MIEADLIDVGTDARETSNIEDTQSSHLLASSSMRI